MKTVYSRNNEDFSFDDISTILSDIKLDNCLTVGTVYFAAEAKYVDHMTYVRVDDVLELFDQNAYDEIDECYDNEYTNVSDDAKQELQDFLLMWSKKHVTLNYWTIPGDSRAIAVTQEDIDRSV